MSNFNWRDHVLQEFVPDLSRLTLVADPDRLLTEERTALALRQKGFDLIEFDDAIAFRYVYESKYRSLWDRGEATDLVVVLRVENTELDELPYDLLQRGRRLSFSLPEIFPNLSYPVLENLERRHLDALFRAASGRQERLGDNATRDLILDVVFGIRVDAIQTDVDLLRALLSLHYKNVSLPVDCAQRLARMLEATGRFTGWALHDIISSSESFFAFLQERWPRFLDFVSGEDIKEGEEEYAPKFKGPSALPFDHDDIRIYIDNLFADGRLQPEVCSAPEKLSESWAKCGIIADEGNVERIDRLFDLVGDAIPRADATHQDWLQLAANWAKLCAVVYGNADSDMQSRVRALGTTLNQSFADWLKIHFCSLVSLPATTPTLLHHVPRKMAMGMVNDSKLALLVIDGFSLQNWVQAQQYLADLGGDCESESSTIFSWIPTVTNVARQAVFAGVPPMEFPRTIYTTNAEDRLWLQFWQQQGLQKREIAYAKGIDDEWLASAEQEYALDQVKALGLVIDKVDKVMHGNQLGAEGMWSQVDLWLSRGFLNRCLRFLLDHGFDVWLTSDHGNVECRGIGRLDEGSTATTRSKRIRIYPNEDLRREVYNQVASGILWEPVGLPADFYPLLADQYDAFIPPGSPRISHGGITLEETIIPLVRFTRRN